jgi:Rrf2 family protein
MIFSKATGYGIRALAYMASRANGAVLGLQEIAEHEHIPPLYLRKILGELRRHRLLRSLKGIHGGYELARPPSDITLWEVFSVLEPDPYFDACILGKGPCDPDSACVLHEEWQKVRKQLVDMLKAKTIAEIASRSNKASGDMPAAQVEDDEYA